MRIDRPDFAIRLSFTVLENEGGKHLLDVELHHEDNDFKVLSQNVDLVGKAFSRVRVFIRINSKTNIEIGAVLKSTHYSRVNEPLTFVEGKLKHNPDLAKKLQISQEYADLVLSIFERIYNLESFQKYIKTKPFPKQISVERLINLDYLDFEDIASLQDFDYFKSTNGERDRITINQCASNIKDIHVIRLDIDTVLDYSLIFFIKNEELEAFNNAITAIQQKQMVKRLTK